MIAHHKAQNEQQVYKMIRQALIALMIMVATPLAAQQVAQAGTTPSNAPVFGPETNLPLPRYVSLKANESNVRRGPSLSHRIDWVFKRKGMPLQVTAEYGHWRRVVDQFGQGGWVHYTMLSGARTVIVGEDMLPLRAKPDPTAHVRAMLEAGVIARLGDCAENWCELRAGGYRGWAPQSLLWGTTPGETRN